MEQLAKYGVSTSYQNLEKFVVHVHAGTHARAPEMVNSAYSSKFAFGLRNRCFEI